MTDKRLATQNARIEELRHERSILRIAARSALVYLRRGDTLKAVAILDSAVTRTEHADEERENLADGIESLMAEDDAERSKRR